MRGGNYYQAGYAEGDRHTEVILFMLLPGSHLPNPLGHHRTHCPPTQFPQPPNLATLQLARVLRAWGLLSI